MGNQASPMCGGCREACGGSNAYMLECTILQVMLQKDRQSSSGVRRLFGGGDSDLEAVVVQLGAEQAGDENAGILLGNLQKTAPGRRKKSDVAERDLFVFGTDELREAVVQGRASRTEGTVRLSLPLKGASLSIRLLTSPGRSGGAHQMPQLLGEARPQVEEDIVATLGASLFSSFCCP